MESALSCSSELPLHKGKARIARGRSQELRGMGGARPGLVPKIGRPVGFGCRVPSRSVSCFPPSPAPTPSPSSNFCPSSSLSLLRSHWSSSKRGSSSARSDSGQQERLQQHSRAQRCSRQYSCLESSRFASQASALLFTIAHWASET